MTRRQVAWMAFDHFKIRDMDGTVLDLSEKQKLRNDTVQSFDTRWDDTVIAMRKQTDDEVLESFYSRQFNKADQLTVQQFKRGW